MQSAEHALKKSIEGEINASAKYKEYSRITLEAGYKGVSRLFKALAFAETFHIKNHQRALGEKYSVNPKPELAEGVIEILEDAAKGETWEYTEMYPDFLKSLGRKINDDQSKLAQLSMEWARDVEKTHAEIIQKVLELVKMGKDIENERIWVCIACGNLVIGELPEKLCPVCKHDIMFYKEITEKEALF